MTLLLAVAGCNEGAAGQDAAVPDASQVALDLAVSAIPDFASPPPDLVALDFRTVEVLCGDMICRTPTSACCYSDVGLRITHRCGNPNEPLQGCGFGAAALCDDPSDCPEGQICCDNLVGTCGSLSDCDAAHGHRLCASGADCKVGEECCPELVYADYQAGVRYCGPKGCP